MRSREVAHGISIAASGSMRLGTCFSVACAFAVLSSSSLVRAEGPTSTQYEKRDAPQQYVAPLAQTTQPSYVPQSVALSGPREIKDWQEGDAVPPGYRPVERTRRGLVVGGAVTFGTLYFFSALTAAIGADSNTGRNPVAAMWIPGAGPFIQMTQTKSATANVFLAIDGAGQCAGIAMLVYGIAVPRTVLVRNDLGENKPPKPEVHAVPLVGGGTTGVGVVGTF